MRGPEIERADLLSARAGDARAFRRVYDLYAAATFAFLRRLVRDEITAEDLLQETFMRVLRSLRGFDPDGPARLSTWIFTIARRVAADEGAARARRAAEPVLVAALAPPAEAVRGDADQATRRALEEAVALLPEAQRVVFVLAACCGFSYEEVAAVEAIDVGTVKSRLHRARAALQAQLGDGGEHAEPEAEQDGRRHDARQR